MLQTLPNLRDLFAAPAVLTRTQLVNAVGPRGMQQALDNDILVRISHGLYAPRAHAGAWWTACAAATMACGPRAAIGGRAALFLWQIDDKIPLTKDVVLPAETGTERRFDGVRVRRTSVDYQVYRVKGLPVVEPELALFQAVAGLTDKQADYLAISVLCSGKVRLHRVRTLIELHNRLPGHGRVARALAMVDAGIHSPLELDASRAVLTGDVAKSFVRQYDITVGGHRYRADAFDAEALLAVEFDGYGPHSEEEQMVYDRERDVWFATLGIQTLRFMTSDVRGRPGWCRERILQVRAFRLHRLRLTS